jgi:hypothetical protein
MLKKTFLCLFFIAEIYCSNAQIYPVIHTNRPRIYADSSRLAWLKYNITIPGDCQNTYNSLVNSYNSNWITDPQLYLAGADSTLWTWDWSSGWSGDEAFLTVFLYKLTNDLNALKRCRFIARQVINRIDTANFSIMDWYVKENLLRQMSDAGDLLLDWCYNDFPDTLQHQLTRSIYRFTREYMNTYILSGAGTSYVSSHNAWNNVFCNQDVLTLYGAGGLDSFQNDTVNQWYQAVYDKWINGFFPCYGYYRDDDGGWNWGAAYAMWSLMDQFQLFENMRIGTGKNFYTDLPWVLNSINQYIYFMQPDNKCIHLGDGQTSQQADRVIYLHARYFNDPRSLWMAQYWSQHAYLTWTIPVFNKLLYKDFTMPVVTQPDNPLDWWTDKVGLSVSRSSWDSSATMVTFFNSPSKRAAHEHRDNNSFTLFKNAPLLLDAGYYDTYGGAHYCNYYQRTIAHNCICVFDSTDNYSCFGNPASNDGGQIESAALQNYNDIFLPQNQRGNWIQYSSATSYEYNIADAELSYDSTKVNKFRRRLLYVKPNRVIIVDHVVLRNTATHQRGIKWIAHFAQRPFMSGSLESTTVPGHIETFRGKDYKAANGNGSVAIRTLLPLATNTTLIGGNGYEYYVNGTNYPPITVPDTNYYSPGNWRIEVNSTEILDSVIYLHTISMGDSINIATPGGTGKQTNYSVGADWNDTLFYFSNEGNTGLAYHVFINVPGPRTVGIFATDLQVGNYNIKVDGLNSVDASTDANGIIQSSIILSPGNHIVEIVQQNTAIYSLTNISESISVFPNPVRTELNIITNNSINTEIQILNAMGDIILRNRNVKKILVSDLTPGIYFLRVKQGNNYFSTKIKKE